MTKKPTRRHRCSECGKLDHGLLRMRDAADQVHWFHPACRVAILQWLAGKDVRP